MVNVYVVQRTRQKLDIGRIRGVPNLILPTGTFPRNDGMAYFSAATFAELTDLKRAFDLPAAIIKSGTIRERLSICVRDGANA